MNHDYDRRKSNLLVLGVGLLGLALLLETRWIWPGLLFLGGTIALVRSYSRPEADRAARLGVALILLGIWATLRFSIPALLVGLGFAMILSALSRSTSVAKPYVDRNLD